MPEHWRKVNVTPIFKQVKKEDPGHHMPVSPTFFPGKLMDQLLLETISRCTNDKKIIKRNQHGFTKRKSCSTSKLLQ